METPAQGAPLRKHTLTCAGAAWVIVSKAAIEDANWAEVGAILEVGSRSSGNKADGSGSGVAASKLICSSARHSFATIRLHVSTEDCKRAHPTL